MTALTKPTILRRKRAYMHQPPPAHTLACPAQRDHGARHGPDDGVDIGDPTAAGCDLSFDVDEVFANLVAAADEIRTDVRMVPDVDELNLPSKEFDPVKTVATPAAPTTVSTRPTAEALRDMMMAAACTAVTQPRGIRKRRPKFMVPEACKDEAYYAHRRRNNAAARRTRLKQKMMELLTAAAEAAPQR